MNKVVILSGGMDSTTLLYDVVNTFGNENVYALSFSYGQKHSIELKYAKWNAEYLGVADYIHIDLSNVGTKIQSALTQEDINVPKITDVIGDPQPITYVPFRNLMMISVGLAIAESVSADEIYVGFQQHDTYTGYWDTTSEFVQAVNDIAEQNRKNTIQVKAPYIYDHKSDIIRMGQKLGVPYEKTMTCYKGEEPCCGQCPTCSDRIKAFKDVGIPDPKEYEVNVDWEK